MGSYILRRLTLAIPTLLIIVFAIVALVRFIPGNAVDLVLSEQGQGSAAARQHLEHQLGLDQSIPTAFFNYSRNLLRGDLGSSLWSKQSVGSMISSRLPVTIELVLSGLVIGTFMGVLGGVIAAANRGSWLDYSVRSLGVLFLSLPAFAVATAVVILPAAWWGWSPPLTYHSFLSAPLAHVGQLIAPALVLASGTSAVVMRLARTTCLDVLGGDFVRTARSKGLLSAAVLRRHVVPNALIPVIALSGLQAAALFSGSVVIESIFGVPGMGRLLTTALGTRDYPVLQGITLLSGIFVVLVNLLLDVLYFALDPRLRLS